MKNFKSLLEDEFGKTYNSIFRYAIRASRRYKKYTIPKRTGGCRIIFQPSAELKSYQRYISREIFSRFPVHSCVYSYQKNKSVKDMALKHLKTKYLLRVDFKDFFPSLSAKNIRYFIRKNSDRLEYELTDNDITMINLLICKADKLTIGAPSSPVISNVLLYDLDEYLVNYCYRIGVTYTRYADDMYFSSKAPDILQDVMPTLKKFLNTYYIELSINEKKNIFTSKKRRQQITGLILTSDNKISTGREKKRYIKSLIYHYMNDNISIEKLNYLKGYLSYLYSIEPQYINNLKTKYSDRIINELLPINKN